MIQVVFPADQIMSWVVEEKKKLFEIFAGPDPESFQCIAFNWDEEQGPEIRDALRKMHTSSQIEDMKAPPAKKVKGSDLVLFFDGWKMRGTKNAYRGMSTSQ